jgi:5-methylcytosine-specific restriction endonuclease McrA
MTALEEKYFNLVFQEKICTYERIDAFKVWGKGTASNKFDLIDDFYKQELEIDLRNENKTIRDLKIRFQRYQELNNAYNNEDRKNIFSDPDKIVKWFESEGNKCGYCGISQDQLHEVVKKRNGNLTLNAKKKRSKGTLEIERLNPSLEQGYQYGNIILACPLCNNAKSNLIDEASWRELFVPSMRKYYEKILK